MNEVEIKSAKGRFLYAFVFMVIPIIIILLMGLLSEYTFCLLVLNFLFWGYLAEARVKKIYLAATKKQCA